METPVASALAPSDAYHRVLDNRLVGSNQVLNTMKVCVNDFDLVVLAG